MMLDKKILDIVRDEDIPYKWLFTYGDTHFLDLARQELENIFPDLYRWTKSTFEQNKPNAFNLLYNLLWMDERVNVLNWEYSCLDHYQNRLALRFQSEKEIGPSTILSFLKGEKKVLDSLRVNLENGIVVFFEHPNTSDETFYVTIEINSANISKNDQDELMVILLERVTDKLKFVDLLLSDEGKREALFTFSEAYVDQGTPMVKANTPLGNSEITGLPIDEPLRTSANLVNKRNDLLNDQPLDNNTITEEEQRSQPVVKVKENEDRMAELQKAIEGDELLRRFLYLEENVKLTTRENADQEVIKYSAIYFGLQELVDGRQGENDDSGWKVHKTKLGTALGIKLKNARQTVTEIHMKKVRKVLNDYK